MRVCMKRPGDLITLVYNFPSAVVKLRVNRNRTHTIISTFPSPAKPYASKCEMQKN